MDECAITERVYVFTIFQVGSYPTRCKIETMVSSKVTHQLQRLDQLYLSDRDVLLFNRKCQIDLPLYSETKHLSSLPLNFLWRYEFRFLYSKDQLKYLLTLFF